MTDQPLFQNQDEQEAAYAPQQLPGGDSERAADLEEGRDTDDVVFVPGAALGVGAAGLMGPGSGPVPVPGVAPVPGDAEEADAEADNQRSESSS